MFGGPRHCGSGDIKILFCHMISQDDVINSSCDFMGRIKASYHSAKFGGQRHSGGGDIFLVCHVILK